MRWRPSLTPGALAAVLSLFALDAPAPGQEGRTPEGFQIALGMIQRGLHEEAIGHLEAFLAGHGDHPRAREGWYRLGTCQVETGRGPAAVRSFRKALEGRGRFRLEPECRYRLGRALAAQGDTEAAAQAFEALERAVDDDHYLVAASRYARGECLRELGRDREAAEAFAGSLEAARGDNASFAFPAAYPRGFALLRTGRPGPAADAFARAREEAPGAAERAESLYLEGDAALRAGALPRAARALDDAIQAGGDFADDARLARGFCAQEQGERARALQAFRTLVQRHRDSALVPRARLEIGRMRYQDGEAEAARRELTTLLEGEGVDEGLRASALELRGLAALATGDPGAARRDLEAAGKSTEDPAVRARLQWARGEAFAEGGAWEPALAAYAAADEGAENDPALRGDARYGRILALHELGRYGDSLALAGEMLEELPGHRLVGLTRFALAENLFALERYPEADQAYQGVPEDFEQAEEAAFKRAWCAYLAGDEELAMERFGRIAGEEEGAFREEALSMQALAALEAEKHDVALGCADRYRARHGDGEFLDRTERVAARVLRERGDLRGAAARLARAAEASGDRGEAGADRLEQAELLFEQGDYETAGTLYGQLAGRDDRVGARALEGLAWCAFELGDDDGCAQAIARGKAHGSIGDDLAGLLHLEYALHHRAGAWDEAERAAAAFLETFPDHDKAPEMRGSLGVAQARGDRLDAARKTLEAAVRADGVPRPDRLWYELAWVRRRTGDEEGALAAFERVAGDSGDVDLAGEARLHLGVAALGRDDLEAAEERLRDVEGAFRARALYRLGFAHLEAEDHGEALRAFESIVAMGEGEPLFLEAVFLAGESRFRAGRHGPAAERYRQLLEAAPDHERAQAARLALGECAVLLDRQDEAVQVLEQWLARNRNGERNPPRVRRARAHLWLGRARQARSEHQRAEEAYQRVTALSEGGLAAQAQFRIGECRKARKDLLGAAGAFVKLPILYTHETWVRKGLLEAGRCYEELQQPAKARRFYEELLSRFPDAPESREARARLRGV